MGILIPLIVIAFCGYIIWRAGDSFWSHVERYNELDSVLDMIEEQKKHNIDNYIQYRDSLRNGNGHILIVSAYKPD